MTEAAALTRERALAVTGRLLGERAITTQEAETLRRGLMLSTARSVLSREEEAAHDLLQLELELLRTLAHGTMGLVTKDGDPGCADNTTRKLVAELLNEWATSYEATRAGTPEATANLLAWRAT